MECYQAIIDECKRSLQCKDVVMFAQWYKEIMSKNIPLLFRDPEMVKLQEEFIQLLIEQYNITDQDLIYKLKNESLNKAYTTCHYSLTGVTVFSSNFALVMSKFILSNTAIIDDETIIALINRALDQVKLEREITAFKDFTYDQLITISNSLL